MTPEKIEPSESLRAIAQNPSSGMIKTNPRGPHKVALGMFVKDEGETLQRCLDSVRMVIDCAVILVDERSTDASLEISKAFVREVGGICEPFRFEALGEMTDREILSRWHNLLEATDGGFSGARNLVASKVPPDHWILWLDGHEYIESPQKLEKAIALLRRDMTMGGRSQMGQETGVRTVDVACASLNVVMSEKEGGGELMQARLYDPRRLHFQSLVHNQLVTGKREPLPDEAVGFNDLIIRHEPTQENRDTRKEQREGMVPRICRLQLTRFPKDTKALFYLAEHSRLAGDLNEAEVAYLTLIGPDGSKCPDERAIVFWHYAKVLIKMGSIKCAKDIIWEGLQERSELPMLWITLSEICLEAEDYLGALRYAQRAIGMEMPPSTHAFDPKEFTFLPWVRVFGAAQACGRHDLAIQAARHLLTLEETSFGCAAECIRYLDEQARFAGAKKWPEAVVKTPSSPPLVVVFDSTGQFTDPIIRALEKKGRFRFIKEASYTPALALYADLIWCEWCDHNLMQASNDALLSPSIPIIARLHGYEAIEGVGELGSINWARVNSLVPVSANIEEAILRRWPETLPKPQRISMIPNAVEPEKWPFKDRNPSEGPKANGAAIARKVLTVASMNHKKGIEVLVQAAMACPEMDFFLAGECQSIRLHDYLRFYAEDHAPNLKWLGRKSQAEIWDLLEDVDLYLQTSPWETFCHGVAEAALSGVPVLLHRGVHGSEFWPEEWLWDSIGDLKGKIQEVFTGLTSTQAYRDAALRFDVAAIAPQIGDEFEEAIRSHPISKVAEGEVAQ